MKLKAILLDLDNTLYSPHAGLLEAGDRRITEFIQRHLGLTAEEADALRRRLWHQYGTTARGLAVEYGIPEAALCREALESLDPAAHLQPDAQLAQTLRELGVPLYLFTNAPRTYAQRVLEALGVRPLFRGIFDLEFLQWVGKPHARAFERVLAALGLPPAALALADDHPPNLATAHRLGLVTIAVGTACPADLHVQDLAQLPRLLRARGLL
jgi:putative hydrolase of the HAD superfamily